MSDGEAEFLFEYRDLSLPRTFRFVENRGRFWLAAYLVPAAFIIGGCLLWYFSSSRQWHDDLFTAERIAAATIGLSTASGIILGLTSILRGESRSFYAYQPLICACLTLLFTAVWWVTVK